MSIYLEIESAQGRLAQLERENKRLRGLLEVDETALDALAKYATHLRSCDRATTTASSCSCGLSDAITALVRAIPEPDRG